MTNFESHGLEQQKTKLGATPVSLGKETEATVHIGSPKFDNRKLEKWSDDS